MSGAFAANSVISSPVYCQLNTFFNGLTLKMDPLLTPQSEFFIIMYQRQCFDVNDSYTACRNFELSLSPHSILPCVSFVRHVHRHTDLASTGLHGEYIGNGAKLLRKQLLSFLSFTNIH